MTKKKQKLLLGICLLSTVTLSATFAWYRIRSQPVVYLQTESLLSVEQAIMQAIDSYPKPKKKLRYVIGRGLALTRKQMLSPTDKGGARQHAVAGSQRADNDADKSQETRGKRANTFWR